MFFSFKQQRFFKDIFGLEREREVFSIYKDEEETEESLDSEPILQEEFPTFESLKTLFSQNPEYNNYLVGYTEHVENSQDPDEEEEEEDDTPIIELSEEKLNTELYSRRPGKTEQFECFINKVICDEKGNNAEDVKVDKTVLKEKIQKKFENWTDMEIRLNTSVQKRNIQSTKREKETFTKNDIKEMKQSLIDVRIALNSLIKK